MRLLKRGDRVRMKTGRTGTVERNQEGPVVYFRWDDRPRDYDVCQALRHEVAWTRKPAKVVAPWRGWVDGT